MMGIHAFQPLADSELTAHRVAPTSRESCRLFQQQNCNEQGSTQKPYPVKRFRCKITWMATDSASKLTYHFLSAAGEVG